MWQAWPAKPQVTCANLRLRRSAAILRMLKLDHNGDRGKTDNEMEVMRLYMSLFCVELPSSGARKSCEDMAMQPDWSSSLSVHIPCCRQGFIVLRILVCETHTTYCAPFCPLNSSYRLLHPLWKPCNTPIHVHCKYRVY